MTTQPVIHLISWDEALDLLSSQPLGVTEDKLTIVKTPLHSLSNLPCPNLTPTQSQRIASFLIELVGVPDYTSTTTDDPIPLRLDLMLQRQMDQSPTFLPPLLRNWCQWFGLQPNPSIFKIWEDFTSNYTFATENLSDPFPKLLQHRLICTNTEHIFLPLPVLIALAYKTQMPDWDKLPALLQQMRHSLLRSKQVNSVIQAYQQITTFLRSPHPTLDSQTIRMVQGRGELVDLISYDWSFDVSQPVIEATLAALQVLHEIDSDHYQELFNRVHGPIWDAVGQAWQKLIEIESRTSNVSVLIDSTNYANSCRVVSRELKQVAEAYTVLTELETVLGVDRYLGGQALAKDLALIHGKVQHVAKHIHDVLDRSRKIYLRQWNLTNIAPLILHLLDLNHAPSQTSDHFPHNCKRVIFLLVDALGFTQFHWFLNTVGKKSAAPLAGNIFKWLREKRAFNESYVLASNLVSITGSCLPTIYTGALPCQTGIIGSHMMIEGHYLNVLKGQDQRHKLNETTIAKIYKRNINTTLEPISQIAHQAGVDVQIFHGGFMGFEPLAEFTYGNLMNPKLVGKKRVTRVTQADRIFAEALPTVIDWAKDLDNKHLAMFYYPLIDSSGHGCGPYTQFQTAELNKLNFVFTHFLIDLAHQAETIFDGQTSVVISADHGMYESATTVVNSDRVRQALGGRAACKGMHFIQDNRAMHVYGVDESDLETVSTKLRTYFETTGIDITVTTRKDPIFKELLYDPATSWSKNCPDLLLQFHGPGVFYHDDKLPSHMFLYGAHGGISVEETFVPLIHFTLTPELATDLRRFF